MVTARIEDPDLKRFLEEECDSKSEAVREGLRLLARKRAGRSFSDLSDEQTEAYNWLLDHVGAGGRITMKTAKNRLAQQLSLEMELIKNLVIRPLEREGYVSVAPRVQSSSSSFGRRR